MEFFSGLVLDRQDDPQGTLLQQEGVKVASGDPASYEQLPDHLFALCMRQEGVELRKYAMHTAEATAESDAHLLRLSPSVTPPPRPRHGVSSVGGWTEQESSHSDTLPVRSKMTSRGALTPWHLGRAPTGSSGPVPVPQIVSS